MGARSTSMNAPNVRNLNGTAQGLLLTIFIVPEHGNRIESCEFCRNRAYICMIWHWQYAKQRLISVHVVFLKHMFRIDTSYGNVYSQNGISDFLKRASGTCILHKRWKYLPTIKFRFFLRIPLQSNFSTIFIYNSSSLRLADWILLTYSRQRGGGGGGGSGANAFMVSYFSLLVSPRLFKHVVHRWIKRYFRISRGLFAFNLLK